MKLDFKKLYFDSNEISADELIEYSDSTESWDELYWIGKNLEKKHGNNEYGKDILKIYEKAFGCGLNIFTDNEMYLDASKSVARLYMLFNKYSDACNMLVILETTMSEVPDWVHLDYASAQLHRNISLRRLALEPKVLLNRLKHASDRSDSTVKRCKAIYSEFINLCADEYLKSHNFKLNINGIIDCAAELGLGSSKELKDLLQICSESPEYDIEKYFNTNTYNEDELSDDENEISDSNSDDYEEKDAANSELYEKLLSLTEIVNGIKSDQSQLLDLLKQREKQITELEVGTADYLDLKEENRKIREDLRQKELLIEKNDNQTRLLVKEITDITGRNEIYIPEKTRKLLILGASEIQTDKLRDFLPIYGFDKKRSKFETDYDGIVKAAGRITPYVLSYDGIIIGPCPHKTENQDGYNCIIEKLKNEEGYPHVEECRTNSISGELKISRNSFKNALKRMQSHLDSISS